VLLRTLEGYAKVIHIEEDATMEQLFFEIQEKTGIPLNETRITHCTKNYSYNADDKTIINVLRGNLKTPNLKEKEADILQYNEIKSLDDSLLFLCKDIENNEKIKDDLHGVDLQWINPANGCYRTDPKIEVENYRINLWYIVPNKNGGIHNHSEQQGHNICEQFMEFHTQLRGNGNMVKYHEQDEQTEYKRFEMKIGKTHPLFCKINANNVSYPWHAYESGNEGALFIAFEDLRISE